MEGGMEEESEGDGGGGREEGGREGWIMMKAHYKMHELTSVWGTISLYSLISLSIAPSLRQIT